MLVLSLRCFFLLELLKSGTSVFFNTNIRQMHCSTFSIVMSSQGAVARITRKSDVSS